MKAPEPKWRLTWPQVQFLQTLWRIARMQVGTGSESKAVIARPLALRLARYFTKRPTRIVPLLTDLCRAGWLRQSNGTIQLVRPIRNITVLGDEERI